MTNCNNHPRELLGEKDMKKAAEAIADLHYEVLTELFEELCNKFYFDAANDRMAGRYKLANWLEDIASNIQFAAIGAGASYKISKPFMEDKK